MDTTRSSLLLRIRDERDRTAWTEFDALYRPMLARFATSRGLHGADMDDVVQHCMAEVHRHIRGFDYDPSRGRFKGWLSTLVNNHVRNLMRGRRERLAAAGEFEIADSRQPTPEEAFEKIWIEEHLRNGLRVLQEQTDEPTFAVFYQYAILDRPVDQVAREAGLTPQQLYKIKWRLTQRLREGMRDLLDEAEG